MTVDTPPADDSTVGAGADSPSSDAAVAAVDAAEAVLAQRFGSTISLVDAEDLAGSGPATVVRARVASSPFSLPRTLVIKHYPDEPVDGEDDAFAREAASYQLFTALSADDRTCPEILAHSADHRLLVIDDLGRAPTLQDKLGGSDARAAETALLSWARSLGRMHFNTANREADFNALLRRLGQSGPGAGQPEQSAPSAFDPAEVAAEAPALLKEELGIETPPAVVAAAERAAEQARSAAFRAFSPVDLWPDNNLVTSDGIRFLDFERGRVRSALVDAAHMLVPFVSGPEPLALPAGVSEAMITSWRAEVTDLWPSLAEEETLDRYLIDAAQLLVWQATCRWLLAPAGASGDGEVPDDNADRDRIHRRDLGAGAAARAAALVTWWRDLAAHADRAGDPADGTEVAAHAHAVARALDLRFGPDLELPLYPAFR
ncbi:hypothetical protein GCM10009676_11420 [Prauserella halophila]|uniref:Aminoglycoside phosphotransferase domain-containing protein n=1 Tax=Prauserella halophila TaxID=185641 RepID=A0ABN1W411_9PSEU|nr:phosphotransferase [Prauserella halophila]MCP2238725.1 hypothetical protein [Prauserella halophila]